MPRPGRVRGVASGRGRVGVARGGRVQPMTFGSLFTGVGGMDLGLEQAGLRCRWQVESEPHCLAVLARHWPDIPRRDDIRTFNPEPTEQWHVDLICGGDPCQQNSRAGAVWRRRGEDLAIHFLRVVGRLRPRFVLRENPAATRADAPWPWFRFRAELESLGYAVLPFRLRSCCLGADHRRERLFLLADLADADRERLEGLDGPGLAAGDGGRTVGDRALRRRGDDLSGPRIRRAVDGLPRGLDVARVKACGNAVDPAVARWIGERLLTNAR